MEIRVFCNKLVTLNNFNSLKLVRLNVMSHNLNKATLTGDVKISGEYLKEENYEMGFEEIVPFTVVFRNDKIKVKNILIEKEKYETLNNQGVDVSFELVVNYDLIDNEVQNLLTDDIENKKNENEHVEEEIIEVPVEIDEKVEMVYSEEINKETKEESVETDKEVEIGYNEKIDKILIEAEKITEEYDKLLSNILNVRNDNERNTIRDRENIIKDNKKVNFKNQNTTFNTITVYYLNKENEIESISKEKRVSINDIYKKNPDFEKTRRIIINE